MTFSGPRHHHHGERTRRRCYNRASRPKAKLGWHLRVLFFGDIVGRPGRRGVASVIRDWTERFRPDIVIANGENAAGGIGITASIARDIFGLGVRVMTLGNHAWQKREVYDYLDSEPCILRPANMPPDVPGRGLGEYPAGRQPLAVINLCGRVFVGDYDDPFRCVDSLLQQVSARCVLVDFHAETSSEKQAFGWYVDGRVSAVIGTHTHVQTADERVLPGGTAYITDVGMCGPQDSVIGMDKDIVLRRFTTQMPARFEVANSEPVVCAVVLEIEEESGRALSIERLQWRG